MNDNARLMVRFCPSRFGKPVEVWLDIEPFMAEPFEPLARDRELYSMPIISEAFTDGDRSRAQKQLMERGKLANYLAPLVADALAKAITQQDPINGYDPGER